jgi:uncharacterized damage-inducible protein DinB
MATAAHVEILKRSFDPSLEMLQVLVEKCPEGLWLDDRVGFPFWQQVWHVAFFIDFWLREDYSRGAEYRVMTFDKDLPVELDRRSDEHLTREEAAEYLKRLQEKADRFFSSLDDARLLEPIVEGRPVTYLDVIIGQIRHIQYHVGHGNCILKSSGAETSGWLAFNEG